ncbi:uncharacterized protein MICPUCDRAFT_56762 [Micromonas pusilla CCMP1545]|uniref:Predicted protein n=1 Tax=Micromonas pusilla (strain CCMP1545) TaxID=564608 RepID=C1MN35_MICPC|nr:uncharacterized protein MICPUCDRAFT_56762 [Micromonas pusilla CCMP1545]EEH59156.1 predicted protein [Micromonas pusilla CCMP1545]|eukprot:XP_003057511.1 predicted protein [Micromonas pusilla CCMP1545]
MRPTRLRAPPDAALVLGRLETREGGCFDVVATRAAGARAAFPPLATATSCGDADADDADARRRFALRVDGAPDAIVLTVAARDTPNCVLARRTVRLAEATRAGAELRLTLPSAAAACAPSPFLLPFALAPFVALFAAACLAIATLAMRGVATTPRIPPRTPRRPAALTADAAAAPSSRELSRREEGFLRTPSEDDDDDDLCCARPGGFLDPDACDVDWAIHARVVPGLTRVEADDRDLVAAWLSSPPNAPPGLRTREQSPWSGTESDDDDDDDDDDETTETTTVAETEEEGEASGVVAATESVGGGGGGGGGGDGDGGGDGLECDETLSREDSPSTAPTERRRAGRGARRLRGGGGARRQQHETHPPSPFQLHMWGRHRDEDAKHILLDVSRCAKFVGAKLMMFTRGSLCQITGLPLRREAASAAARWSRRTETGTAVSDAETMDFGRMTFTARESHLSRTRAAAAAADADDARYAAAAAADGAFERARDAAAPPATTAGATSWWTRDRTGRLTKDDDDADAVGE